MRVLVLPGMDGGGKLLAPFCEALPPGMRGEVVSYPSDRPLDYAALQALVRRRLHSSEPTVLVAESFSGPLAIRIAADPPPCLRALVLVGTFAVAPLPRILRLGVGAGLFVFPLPRAGVRALMVGLDTPREAVDQVRDVVGDVHPMVLASRLRDVLSVDARDALRRVRIPILCVEGARDRLLPDRRALDRVRPDLHWVTIDGPHLLLSRRPVEAAHAVARFAERHQPQDRSVGTHTES